MTLASDHRREIVMRLLRLLSDVEAAYQRTHLYHWNISGPTFIALHKLLNEQYDVLIEEKDQIAEHILTLGAATIPPNFATPSTIPPVLAGWTSMLQNLVQLHQIALSTIAYVVEATTDTDQATLSLLGEWQDQHLKAIMFLNKHLSDAVAA